MAFMLPFTGKRIIAKLGPIRAWTEEREEATGHWKLFQEVKSDNEHSFSKETKHI